MKLAGGNWGNELPTLAMGSRSIPLAVTTGSYWPATTENSIISLRELAITDCELTLQAQEFSLTFDRELDMPLYPQLAEAVRSGALHIHSVHAPHMDAEHGHSLRAREDYLTQSLRVCHHLGGHVLVTHPFHLFVNHEEILGYLSGIRVDVREVLLPGMNSILDQAHQRSIVVSLENVNVWADDGTGFFNVPGNVRRLLNDVAHPNLGVTLDLIHAQLIGNLDEFLDVLADHIVNLHVADLVLPATRVAPGEGILNWGKLISVFKQLPHLQQVTIELTRARPAEVARAVSYLTSCW